MAISSEWRVSYGGTQWLAGDRGKHDPKHASSPDDTLDFDTSGVLGDQCITDAKADASASTRGLGGIKRFEDLRQVGTANSFTLVNYLGDHSIARRVGPRAKDDRTTLVHRIHGIDEECHEDLNQLLLARRYEWERRPRSHLVGALLEGEAQ